MKWILAIPHVVVLALLWIAALLLTTEVLVVDKKEPAPAMPGGGMPDMGGMGGMGGMM